MGLAPALLRARVWVVAHSVLVPERTLGGHEPPIRDQAVTLLLAWFLAEMHGGRIQCSTFSSFQVTYRYFPMFGYVSIILWICFMMSSLSG